MRGWGASSAVGPSGLGPKTHEQVHALGSPGYAGTWTDSEQLRDDVNRPLSVDSHSGV